MPTVTVYPTGTTAGTPASARHVPESKRGDVAGWSKESARRHAAFLRSIDHQAVEGALYSFTLTVRDTPETAAEWSRIRNAWLTRLRTRVPVEPRSSLDDVPTTDPPTLLAYHWVTEWQRRGTPHMHGALLWSKPLTVPQRLWVLRSWVEVAKTFRPSLIAQDLGATMSAASWSRYVAKHSARSAGHYQRRAMPPGWKASGRLWGASRDGWPRRAERFAVDAAGGYQYRRLVRGWRIADARKEKDPETRRHRIASARRMLRAPEGWAGRVRGVSEWVPEEAALEMLRWVAWAGYDVQYVSDDLGGGDDHGEEEALLAG